eukprot:6487979-Amphidinium_carterae.1
MHHKRMRTVSLSAMFPTAQMIGHLRTAGGGLAESGTVGTMAWALRAKSAATQPQSVGAVVDPNTKTLKA